MSCDPAGNEMHRQGALEPRIAAGLSGFSLDQLERWRASGLMPASLENPEPPEMRAEFDDPPSRYDWDDLHRILAAAKLLELGLPEAELPEALARLDAACARWATDLAPIRIRDALPGRIDARRFFAERWHEGPLGRLFEYADVVEMAPGRRGGVPVIRGTRLDTWTVFSEYCVKKEDDAAAASACWITPYQARRAVQFERALGGEWRTDAPSRAQRAHADRLAQARRRRRGNRAGAFGGISTAPSRR